MRTIGHGDILAAARAVVHLSDADKDRVLARMFASAHAADRYRKRTGRAHKEWGNGTLYAAAIPAGSPALPQADLSDSRYVAALGHVLDALMAWRTRNVSSEAGGISAESGLHFVTTRLSDMRKL